MLRMIHSLKGYELEARDDTFGRVKDFLFDEDHWAVRYMVADTGRWLPKHKVLVSPISLLAPDWASRTLAVDLTREAIENAPPLEADEPVSRRFEREWYDTLGYAYYWEFNNPWGFGMYPFDLAGEQITPPPMPETQSDEDEDKEEDDRSFLRSTEEVRDYHVQASDGAIGHVEDFILDTETWLLRYLVVNTRNWLPGRRVLLAPAWTDQIDWARQHITTPLTQKQLEESPEFNPEEPVNRAYEEKLYDYYGRPGYWV